MVRTVLHVGSDQVYESVYVCRDGWLKNKNVTCMYDCCLKVVLI